MRRIHLPDEHEGGWSYDPSSIDHVIEVRLRHDEANARRMHEREATNEATALLKRGVLGLNQIELDLIWREGLGLFLRSAVLSDELRDERERFRATFTDRVERFVKDAERERNHEISRLAERHAVMFARVCDGAIKWTSGEFGDLLTQAMIARRGRKDFPLNLRVEMWTECLRFAMKLARFELSGVWVERAWGIAPSEQPLPHLYRLDTIAQQTAEGAKFHATFKPRFEERLRHGSPQWLDEAERKIRLRILLSSAQQRRVSLDDPSKLAIANLLFRSPNLGTKQICTKLDAANARNENLKVPPLAPVPHAWRKQEVRLWIEAYERFPGKVETYISKIRNGAGIPRNRHRANLPHLPSVNG